MAAKPASDGVIHANISDYKDNLVSFGIVFSAIKATSKQLNSTDVTNRNKIEPLTQETLQNSLDSKSHGYPQASLWGC